MHIYREKNYTVLFTDGSINLSWKANLGEAKKNWKTVKQLLNKEHLNLAYLTQIHSSKVILATKPGYQGPGDGIITEKAEIALVVLVADCLPIALAEETGAAIGILHCGWKPLAKGIIENCIEKFGKLGVESGKITAYLGPCAGVCCYEVSREFYNIFPENSIEQREGKCFFDMRRFAKYTLTKLGVRKIYDVNICTICSSEYFSYRRGEIFSRQSGLIIKNKI